MRLSPLLLVATILVVGCQVPGSPEGTMGHVGPLTVHLEASTWTDELATVHTKAELHLEGAVEQTIDLGDIQGDLMAIDPNGWERFKENGDIPLAAYTAWWAGQGEEIVVILRNDTPALIVERRYGDEGGACTDTTTIADIPLPSGVQVTIDSGGLPETPQSSIEGMCG
jgi:hypothetical protein